jgi:hypothetical protein
VVTLLLRGSPADRRRVRGRIAASERVNTKIRRCEGTKTNPGNASAAQAHHSTIVRRIAPARSSLSGTGVYQ